MKQLTYKDKNQVASKIRFYKTAYSEQYGYLSIIDFWTDSNLDLIIKAKDTDGNEILFRSYEICNYCL